MEPRHGDGGNDPVNGVLVFEKEEVTMSDNQLFPVPASVAADALVDNDRYQEMYDQSVTDPVGFWGEHGKRINWI